MPHWWTLEPAKWHGTFHGQTKRSDVAVQWLVQEDQQFPHNVRLWFHGYYEYADPWNHRPWMELAFLRTFLVTRTAFETACETVFKLSGMFWTISEDLLLVLRLLFGVIVVPFCCPDGSKTSFSDLFLPYADYLPPHEWRLRLRWRRHYRWSFFWTSGPRRPVVVFVWTCPRNN